MRPYETFFLPAGKSTLYFDYAGTHANEYAFIQANYNTNDKV